jgi:hypothetical protein
MSIPNTTPVFVGSPNMGAGTVTTANSNRDGTGALVTILTAGAQGSRYHRMRIKATGTTTAGMIRIFMYNGVTHYLYKEILVAAITASATVAAFEYELQMPNEDAIVLAAGWSMKASTEKTETFNIFLEGGDY